MNLYTKLKPKQKTIKNNYFWGKVTPTKNPLLELSLRELKRIWTNILHHTLSYSNFILKIKNTFPTFGYIMHFWFAGLSKSFVPFCKSILSKMASVKTNKNKNRTPLLKTNFSRLETLSFDPKRFLHSKGPKNAICLWLRLGNIIQCTICNVYFRSVFLVSAKDKLHF